MAGTYFKQLENTIKVYNQKKTATQEKQILETYLAIGKDLIAKIAKAPVGSTSNRIYKEYAYNLQKEIAEILRSNTSDVALNSLHTQTLATLQLLSDDVRETLDGKLQTASIQLSKDAVTAVYSGGLYKDGLGLSARLWAITNQSAKEIQDVVAKGLASGMSAKEMSKLLEKFVDPIARKTISKELMSAVGKRAGWGGLEYKALRLARTTISHAATAAMKSWGAVNPYAEYVQWFSAHAPGRTCQRCLDLDERIFKIQDCPFDHPNGLCWQEVYYDKSLSQMAQELNDWANGGENEYLQSWADSLEDE